MKATRRSFLRTLGAGAAGLALGRPADRLAAALPPLPRVGLQLWTVREAIEKDAASTLHRLADLGYTAVETAFWPGGMTHAQGGRLLRDAGISVFAAHVEIPVGDHRDAILEVAEAYDCNTMVWHGWPEDARYQTLDGIRDLADIYNEANAFLSANGLRFGLHNHWWEFQEIPQGGLPYYLIRPMLEPDIFYEIDTYWTKVAGLDPAKVVGDFGNTVRLLHIKDALTLETEGTMVAAGQGLQDFPSIGRAGHGNVEWMIVELDFCETDMFDAIEQSRAYLIDNRLALE